MAADGVWSLPPEAGGTPEGTSLQLRGHEPSQAKELPDSRMAQGVEGEIYLFGSGWLAVSARGAGIDVVGGARSRTSCGLREEMETGRPLNLSM